MSSEWKPKRFWKQADIAQVKAGWQVLLDGRPVRTPAKAQLAMPTRALARAVAEEWDAQETEVDPNAMPLTRAVNAAVDKVVPQHHDVAAMLAAYGATDLLCYRATEPAALHDRQRAAWDPLLDWAAEHCGGRLHTGQGIVPIAQPEAATAALGAPLFEADAFRLTALHDLVTVSGSLVLALAVDAGRIDADEAHRLSRIDEDWQIEQWGDDDEALKASESKRAQLRVAELLLSLLREE